MGVYWAKAASKYLEGQVEIVDLRTLNPLDSGDSKGLCDQAWKSISTYRRAIDEFIR